MKNIKKSIVLIIAIFLVLTMVSSVYNIANSYDWSVEKNNLFNQTADANVTKSVNNIAGTVITVAKIICAGVAVVMLLVLAMKYMMSAPSDRAEIKKHAVVYVVGAVIMFAASGILSIIESFASNID